MTNIIKNGSSLLWFATLAATLICAAAQSTGGAMSKKQLEETIGKIRKGGTSTIRATAAQHLRELTRTIDPDKVDR
jgi:hypothetical protein